MALANAEGVACLAALARTYSVRLACPPEDVKVAPPIQAPI